MKLSLQRARLIANPHHLGLLWGKSRSSLPSYLLPHCLLLHSPDDSMTLYTPYTPVSLDSPFQRRIAFSHLASGFRIVNNLNSFIKYIQKEIKKYFLEVDTAISHHYWEQIQPLLPPHWNFIAKPYSQLDSELIEHFVQNYSLVEMSLIYACSYIKSRMELEEIRYQIHDYLQAQSNLRGDVHTYLECFNPQKKKITLLTPPCLIHFEIDLKERGIPVTFFKTLALINPTHPKSLTALSKLYQETLKVFQHLIKKIDSQKLPTAFQWGKTFPKLFKTKKWQIYFHSLSEGPSFRVVKKDEIWNIEKSQVYSIGFRDTKCGIIMGVAMITHNDRIEIIDKYGWDYLQFPW